ncbi:hypothetical protein GCM10008915_36280 [Bifidobacterium pullorum subsp. gallinarum]
MTDYKTQFNEDTTALIATNIADRTQRMAAVQALIDRYVEANGEVPDRAQLERLTDYILRDELTDRHPDKITRTEYPFMSAWQLELRHDRETSLKIAEEVGTDGRDYRVPKRRRRTNYENWRVDVDAKIRNDERAEQYKRDTATVTTAEYNLRENGGELTESFVQCRGITIQLRK